MFFNLQIVSSIYNAILVVRNNKAEHFNYDYDFAEK